LFHQGLLNAGLRQNIYPYFEKAYKAEFHQGLLNAGLRPLHLYILSLYLPLILSYLFHQGLLNAGLRLILVPIMEVIQLVSPRPA